MAFWGSLVKHWWLLLPTQRLVSGIILRISQEEDKQSILEPAALMTQNVFSVSCGIVSARISPLSKPSLDFERPVLSSRSVQIWTYRSIIIHPATRISMREQCLVLVNLPPHQEGRTEGLQDKNSQQLLHPDVQRCLGVPDMQQCQGVLLHPDMQRCCCTQICNDACPRGTDSPGTISQRSY